MILYEAIIQSILTLKLNEKLRDNNLSVHIHEFDYEIAMVGRKRCDDVDILPCGCGNIIGNMRGKEVLQW